MFIIHVSAECYPAAKSGGLGDVVGALPKYQNADGDSAAVILPKYGVKWILEQEVEEVYSGSFYQGYDNTRFAIERIVHETLGYDLYVVDIPEFFARNGIYSDEQGNFYRDEAERYIAFQRAAMDWLVNMKTKPDIIHCHDHQAGLIPFFAKYTVEYGSLRYIPTVFTIHNGNYQGAFSWQKAGLLPHFYENEKGYLDWQDTINPMASAIRCAWAFTTVSPSYLQELQSGSGAIGELMRSEAHRGRGILNGIDTEVWDPITDSLLKFPLADDVEEFKQKNKEELCELFGLDKSLPLISFIGRFAREKGAFILPDSIRRFFGDYYQACFFVLGSGDKDLATEFHYVKEQFGGRFNNWIGYNESLAHLVYAASDFLVMPSMIEPCGLNQMYSMRYGTIPIVRSIGGLKDSVIDLGDDGEGIRFDHLEVDDVMHAWHRAIFLYKDRGMVAAIRERIMKKDFSWQNAAKKYKDMYIYLNE